MKKISPKDIKWKMVISFAMSHEHIIKFADEELGLVAEIITPKINEFEFGEQKNYYYIKGELKEYTTERGLCKAWNELQEKRTLKIVKD